MLQSGVFLASPVTAVAIDTATECEVHDRAMRGAFARPSLPNANIDYAMTSRDVKSYESAILRVGDNRANLPNANIDYATTSRDVKSYESAILRVGDNRAHLPNANRYYATTSRDV